MIRIFSFIIFVSLATIAFSQDYVGKSRSKVRKLLARYIVKTDANVTIEETDSSIAYHLRDSKYKYADFIYCFDANDRCISEFTTSCDTCVNKFMNQALKLYTWIQVGTSSYVSKFSKRLLIESGFSQGSSFFRIRKVNWTQAEYNQLIPANRG